MTFYLLSFLSFFHSWARRSACCGQLRSQLAVAVFFTINFTSSSSLVFVVELADFGAGVGAPLNTAHWHPPVALIWGGLVLLLGGGDTELVLVRHRDRTRHRSLPQRLVRAVTALPCPACTNYLLLVVCNLLGVGAGDRLESLVWVGLLRDARLVVVLLDFWAERGGGAHPLVLLGTRWLLGLRA